MECKEIFIYVQNVHKSIKVEPYWNVKSISGKAIALDKAIKVEPYWNVKSISGKAIALDQAIKVEPYWNVKCSGILLGDYGR